MGQRKSASGFPLPVLAFRAGGNPDSKCFAGRRLYSAVMVRVSVLLVVTGIGEPYEDVVVEVRRTLVSLITVGSGLTTVVVLQLQTVITGMAAVIMRRSFIEVSVGVWDDREGEPKGHHPACQPIMHDSCLRD